MNGLSAGLSHHHFVRAVAVGLRRCCGVSPGGRLIVAVSGGADSVALLRALAALAPRRRWRLELAVGHVQHHLRGELAERDASFVENLAARMDLAFLRADLTWRDAGGARLRGNTEAQARQMRYEALATMAQTFDAQYVATAHHGDDQLETLLMRVLRGSGVAGLRGIAWRRRLAGTDEASGPMLIRPMLRTTRREATDFLDQIAQPWREDHTNLDRARLRARLRQEVLPVLRSVQPDAAHKAVSLADHARQVHALVRTEVERHYEHVMCDGDGVRELDRGEAKLLPRIVLTGLLRRLLREAGVPGDRLGRRAMDPIVRAVRDRHGAQRVYELAGGVKLIITRETVTVGG